MSDAIYTPSKWQQEVHSLRATEILGAGSAGVGKTRCLLADPLAQVIVEHERTQNPSHPHHIKRSTGWALHLRRQLTELKQTIALSQILFPAIDPGAHYDAGEYTWTFTSGYHFQFGHCKDADDHTKYLSSEFSHIAFDELSTFSKEQYDGITSRLRSSDPVLKNMLRIISMSNPGVSPGSDPHWVRKRFVDPCPEGKKLIRVKLRRGDGTEFFRTRIYWPGRLSDNPNPDFKTQYEETLLDKPAHIRKAYLEGDWYFAPGSFFGEDFDPKLHVVSVFKVPSDWPVFRSMDWGFKSKGVIHWFAMDPDGDLFVFDEYVFRERTDAQVAEDVRRIEKRHGLWGINGRSRVTGPADTQLWEERGDSAKRKVDVFNDAGVPWVQADKKSRRDNAERLLKRLKDHKGGLKNPGIMFMSNCREIITSLPQLRTSELDPEEPEKGGNDHAYDSVSYGVAYASHGSSRIQVSSDDRDELDDLDDTPAVRTGRYGYGSEVL